MNTIEKITVRENKALKLNNVLIREINEKEDDFNKAIHMMESYIKSKGNSMVGPLITYSGVKIENDELKIIMKIIGQVKNPIHNVENPYRFETQLKVSNCLFARYREKEENLQMAYSKLQVHAFENEIKLKGDSYTIFVDNKEGDIVADVFMEVDNGEGL